MTKTEFITRQQALKRADTFLSYISLIMFLVGFPTTVVVRNWIREKPPSVQGWMLFGYLFFAIMFAAGIAFLIGRSFVYPDRRGVACPACGKPLVRTAGEVALASGHCGYCGAEVFDREPSFC